MLTGTSPLKRMMHTNAQTNSNSGLAVAQCREIHQSGYHSVAPLLEHSLSTHQILTIVIAARCTGNRMSLAHNYTSFKVPRISITVNSFYKGHSLQPDDQYNATICFTHFMYLKIHASLHKKHFGILSFASAGYQ